MRLWHKDIINVLPREQLVAQWRELSAIAGNLLSKGNPNHILVNKIIDYPFDHFISYAYYVRKEMNNRGYKTMDKVWNKICSITDKYQILSLSEIFPQWHNNRYFKQCFYNLEEKYDCKGISVEDWSKIKVFSKEKLIE